MMIISYKVLQIFLSFIPLTNYGVLRFVFALQEAEYGWLYYIGEYYG